MVSALMRLREELPSPISLTVHINPLSKYVCVFEAPLVVCCNCLAVTQLLAGLTWNP